MEQENLTIPEGLDPQAVNLARAIRQQESGGDYNKSGDSGSSLGAYQWNNQPNGKSVPLQKGEIPSNFTTWAKEVGLDPTDFSPKNQDMVAYQKIKKLKDAGNNVVDIAAIWNGGDAKRQDPNYVTPNGLPSQKKGVYDVPAYAKAVNDYYQELKTKNADTSTQDPPRETFADAVKNIQATQPNADLQVGNPTTPGNTLAGNLVSNLTPGNKLAQGAGYGLAASLGSQKGLIEANNRGIDIEGQLIKQIKDNKAKGKDTTRLEKALKELDMNLQESGNQVSDIGTGGIKTSDVIKSAAGLATLPVASYGAGLIGGLIKGGSALASEPVEAILSKVASASGDSIKALSSAEKVNALTEALSTADAGTKPLFTKALQELGPSVLKEAGVGSFSELNPKSAKVLGLGLKGLKILTGGALAGAGIGEGSSLIKGLFGQK